MDIVEGSPCGWATVSNADGGRSVQSPEFVTKGGEPDVWRCVSSRTQSSNEGNKVNYSINKCFEYNEWRCVSIWVAGSKKISPLGLRWRSCAWRRKHQYEFPAIFLFLVCYSNTVSTRKIHSVLARKKKCRTLLADDEVIESVDR